MKYYYIWSNEHKAWWKPGRWGYTHRITEAGIFKEDDARKIVKDANIYQENEKMVPVEGYEEE